MNGKGVRSFWLNALIITTVVLMWVTIAGSVVAGIAIASAVNGSSSSNRPECKYDYDC